MRFVDITFATALVAVQPALNSSTSHQLFLNLRTMKSKNWLIAFIAISLPPTGKLMGREWKSADGSKSFTGDLRDYDPPMVTVANMQNGSVQKFDEKILGAEEREYVKDNASLVKTVLSNSMIGIFGIDQVRQSEQISASEKNEIISKYSQRRFRVVQLSPEGVLCTELTRRVDFNLYFADPLYEQKRKQCDSLNSPYWAMVEKSATLQRMKSGHPVETFWLWTTTGSPSFAIGEEHQFDLYWAGMKTLVLNDGSEFTIRTFAPSMETALLALKPPTKTKPVATPSEVAQVSGSAFAITSKGHLVTNAHVIEGAKSLKVKYPEGEMPVKVLAVDEVNDLAILKIDSETTPLVFSEATLKAGDEIMAAGFPNPDLQGTSIKLTRGIISSLKGIKDDARHFQIDAAVQPGNSGGPLLNKDGELAGIVVARLGDAAAIRATGAIPQNVNYAIKLDYLTPLIKTVDGLWEIVSTQKKKPDRTAGEKATASTFLLINEAKP